MSETITCPQPRRLQDLLDGHLSDEQQAELNTHLENCRSCQQRLESLAAGKETWTEAARNLNVGSATPEAGLERVMAESKREGHCEPESPDLEAPLDFLTPSDDPSHLGRLGPYEIIELISRGGMSTVFKAFDPSLHRVVAIKVLAPQLATTAAARARFRREGYAAAAVSHEHVVAVYGVDEVNGLPYLVMEYISGESLQERLNRDGPLELKEILRIGMQSAQGLAAAHAQGLVHRDIKPANILLHNGVARVKITDFGLARAVDDATLTQSGFVAGTPQYMSPEQARGDAIDHRTDLFSLGSVLYAMCAGRPPFRASTTMGVLKRVSDERARAVREVNPEVPPWLADIIGKLHAKNPAERFQSAAEVGEVLGHHLARLQQGLAISTIAMPAPAAGQASRQSGIFRKPWAIAAALLPLIAGLFVVSEATGVTSVTEFVATVLRINTPEGTLVVETDDPNVEVVVDNGDIKIRGAGPKEIRVKAGEHRIRATREGKDVPVADPLVTVTRGGKTIVKVRLENPAVSNPAIQVPASKTVVPRPRELATLRGHDWVIWSLAFAPDGKTLISAGGGPGKATTEPVFGELKAWDIAPFLDRARQPRPPQGQPLWSAKSPSIVSSVAISPGGTTLATAEADGTIRLREADTGWLLSILRGHQGPVYTVAFAPDGQTLASAGLDRTVKIWHVGTRKLLESFDSGSTRLVKCLAFSRDGKTLAVGGEDMHEPGGPYLADPDGNIVGIKRHTHLLRLFDVGSWRARASIRHGSSIECLAFSPDGKLLATGSGNRATTLWDVATGKELAVMQQNLPSKGIVRCLAFSPNGSLLVAGGDQPVTLWNVPRRQALLVLAGESKAYTLAFSPDGKTLAFAGQDRTIKLWDVGAEYRSTEATADSVRQQHLATLRQMAARAEQLYKAGAASEGALRKAQLAVLEAELKVCDSAKERVQLRAKILEQRRQEEKRTEQLWKAGAAAEGVLLEARRRRQEAEIALEHEKTKSTSDTKKR